MGTVRATKVMAERAVREIDWEKFDAITDEEIEAQIAADPDLPPIMGGSETTSGD